MDGLYDELRVALHAVWRRRWLALGVAWGLCLAGWLVVSQIPNQYVSTARVAVQFRSILPAQDGSVQQVERQKDIERVRQTLTSAVNLRKVVLGTDLAATVANERDVADRIAALAKAIKVTPSQQDANLFEISATIANPGAPDAANAKLARAVVQKMIDIFVEGNLQSNRDETAQSLRFLDQQIEQRQRQLQDAEARKAQFQAQYLGSLPGTGTVTDRMGQARTQLSQVEADLAAAQSSLAAVNGQLAGTPPSVPGTAGTMSGPARARLAAIQGQLAEARARGWTDSHPDVIALNNQLALAQQAARAEPVGGDGGQPNPLYLSLRSMQADRAAQVAALTQRKAQLQGDLAMLDQRMASDPVVAADMAAIDRDYLVLKDQYDKLLASREQVRIRSSVQTDFQAVRFSVIDPPTAPTKPAAPNRPLLLFAVLVVGLGGGVAAAFGMSKLQTTYPTAGRLEKASGMPVIGAIGEVVTQAHTAVRARQLKLFAGGAGGLVAAFAVLMALEFVQRGLVA